MVAFLNNRHLVILAMAEGKESSNGCLLEQPMAWHI